MAARGSASWRGPLLGMLLSGHVLADIDVNAPFPPTPDTAKLDPVVAADLAQKGYHVGEIKDDFFWITDGNYHSLAIETNRGVIVVDAPLPLPFFPPLDVLGAVGEVTDKPITHLIYTHAHTDHIGGAGAIKAAYPDVQIIAHAWTRRILQQAEDPRRPVPDTFFLSKRPLTIAEKRLELHYVGNTHQEGNIIVYAPREKVLMAVDIIYPGWVPFRRLALSNDIAGWVRGHDAILRFDFDILVAGHLTRLGTREDVLIQKEYVADIQQYIDEIMLDASALLGGGFGAEGLIDPGAAAAIAAAGENPFATGSKWALFRGFFDASVTHCADKLDDKWLGVLGGAETFNFSNCEAWFVARRLGVEH